MRAFLLSLMLIVSAIFAALTPARAADPIRITEGATALDLSDALEITRGQGAAFQVSAAPGADGVVRRIEIRAISDKPTGNWAVFSLANPGDEQIDRLIVTPHFRMAESGVMWPDLGAIRVTNITPSEGFALDRVKSLEADIFALTLNPGSVVTFIVEMASDRIPEMTLWDPEAYKDSQNAFTLFRGIVIGIAGLLALFLTIVFVVRGTSLFPATAALAWGVLVYVALDFGFLSRALTLDPGVEPIWRAGTEVALAAILVVFLFAYLRLNRWNNRFLYLGFIWLAALALLAFFAVLDPSMAAGIARFSFAATVMIGVPLIILLGMRGYDRAVMLVPTWILLIAWLTAAWMTVTGQIDNPVIQPALGGGLVLIIVLLGFTVMQHAFAGGSVEKGLFSDLERKALALTGSGDVVWDWDVLRDRISLVPDISERIGLDANALAAQPKAWLDHIHIDDRERFRTTLDAVLEHKRGRINDEFRLQAPSGRLHWYALRARPVIGHDGEVMRCIGTMADITEQKLATERLLQDSVTDHLTGLPNRHMFLSTLQSTLTLLAVDGKRRPSIFLIDIDGYRHINEQHGLQAGDTILLTLSARLQEMLGPLDALCRMGGDQFALMLVSEQEPAGIAAFADRLNKAINLPIALSGRTVELTASIGLASAMQAGVTADSLLKDAEIAMHEAKRFGGDRIEPFRPAFRALGTDPVRMESDLKRALERDEIELVYQPIIRISDNAISGFEALMRWRHPRRGVVSPSEFIPVAEKSGLITKLGLFAMQQAAAQLRSWQFEIGDVPLFMSVNLSSVQILRQDLVADVTSVLAQSGLNPKLLRLEVTESVVMEDPERAAVILRQLRGLGISLSLDDFGTGHSSLSYLTRFPFDCIKIDRSFLISESTKRDILLKALVTLGVDLGMTVIAEGVSNDADAAALGAMGCKYVQSFAFGEPRNAEQTLRLLRGKSARIGGE